MRANCILVVDDDESLRWVMQAQLQQAGYRMGAAASAEETPPLIEGCTPGLVITDLRMPGMSGLGLLKRLRAQCPEVVVIVFPAFGTVETAAEAIKAGAYDYIPKPVDQEQLLLTVRRALEHARLRAEVRTLRKSLDRKYGFENFLGRSKALMTVLDRAAACLGCHTGKEAASHALSNTSALGESCDACHGPQADFSVDKVHAR